MVIMVSGIDGWSVYVNMFTNCSNRKYILIDIYEPDGAPEHTISKADMCEAVNIWAEHMRESIGLEDYLQKVFKI